MTDHTPDATPLSRELDDVLAEYISVEEAGTAPDRASFLARYPQHVEELRKFFANRDQMRRLIRPLQGAETAHRSSGQPVDKIRYFGDYELLEEVAVGGMGIVYKARQASLNRIVAVKMILKGALATDEDVKRFRTEAEAAANLQHPGIVAIHEVGLHEGQHYFSMDFVEGRSLAELIRDQPLSVRQAAEYLREAAEAVHYAHQQGTLHRDLKPSNIMIDGQDRVRITDFGLAKRIEGNSDLTLSGQILGTPSYMPPEQALGRRSLIAAASDIYSLGAVLYELLAGRPPFRGESPVETLKQVETLDPVSPRLLNPATPADLETICLKCLEKEPHKRYGTAQLLADDLGRFLRGETIVARPVGRVERSWRWCRRNPVVAGLATAVAVALVSGTAVSSYFAVRSNTFAVEADARAQEAIAERERADAKTAEALSERQRADETAAQERIAHAEAGRQRQAAEQLAKDAEASAERARRLLYVSDMNLAQQSWKDTNVGRVLELLKPYEQNAGKQDLRGWEWDYLWKLCHSDLRTLTGHIGIIHSVAFSPDGKRIASGSEDRTIKVWDTESGVELATLKGHTREVWSVAFSPDGKRIASASLDNTIKLWNAESGAELATLKGHAREVWSVAFSPDGKRIASGSEDRTIKVWDAESGAELVTLKGHADLVLSVAFSPDGKRIASACRDQTIKLWNAESWAELVTLRGHTRAVRTVTFSPDGQRVASGCDDKSVRVWDVERGVELATFGHAEIVISVAFSPDGKRIAAGIADRTITLRDVVSGAKLATLKGHANLVASVAFSPDGKRIASGSWDRTIKLWDAEPGAEPALLKGHANLVVSVAFSPDGKRIASGSWDRTIKLWDVERRTELATLKGHASVVSSLAFSPDGERVASGSWDQTIKMWDAASGAELITFKGHAADIVSVAFSPDGKRIASGSNGPTVKLWNAENGAELDAFKGHGGTIQSVAFSPDGKRIASGGEDRTIKLWDVERRTELATLKGHASVVSSLAFSPDGKVIASGSRDQAIKLWHVASGAELATLKGHAREVWSVAFSPDGKRITSASLDNTIKLWDAESGAELATLQGPAGPVGSVAFSPDGKRLVAGAGPTICLYNATVLNDDEKMARFQVRHLFDDHVFSDEVIAAVQNAEGWNQAMRNAGIAYARSRANDPASVYSTTWNCVANGKPTAPELERARQIAETVRTKDRDNPKFRRLLALIYYRLGQPAEALDVLEPQPAQEPVDAALRVLANMALDRSDEVLRVGKLLISANDVAATSPNVELAFLRGLIAEKLAAIVKSGEQAYGDRDWQTAAENMERAVALGATGVNLFWKLGDALAMLGKWKEAADRYGKAVELTDRSWIMLFQWALLRLAAGDDAGYREACADLMNRHGEKATGLAAVAIVLACVVGESAIDDMQRVLVIAQRAAASDPRNPTYRQLIGAVQFRSGQNEEAIATLKRTLPQHVLAELAAPKQLDQIRASRLAGETILALAYRAQKDPEALAKQLGVLRELVSKLEETSPQFSDGVAPWTLPFIIHIAKRELARMEAEVPAASPAVP